MCCIQSTRRTTSKLSEIISGSFHAARGPDPRCHLHLEASSSIKHDPSTKHQRRAKQTLKVACCNLEGPTFLLNQLPVAFCLRPHLSPAVSYDRSRMTGFMKESSMNDLFDTFFSVEPATHSRVSASSWPQYPLPTLDRCDIF